VRQPGVASYVGDASDSQDNKRGDEEITNATRHGVEFTDISTLATTRRLLAEGVGTFALTLVAAGANVIAALYPDKVSFAAQVVAPGLLVMVVIYSLGTISGAHVNPFVTLAFALRADFPWRRVWGYWIVQFAGAILAALLLRLLFGVVGHLGATLPKGGIWQALVMEMILTFFLVTVILATATNTQIVGHNAALAVGATIALDGLFAGPISGASMYPARSLGPRRPHAKPTAGRAPLGGPRRERPHAAN